MILDEQGAPILDITGIDVALHGTEGHAGPWAATAKTGDRLVAVGPGGKWEPDPKASWTLLAGDETKEVAVLGAIWIAAPM